MAVGRASRFGRGAHLERYARGREHGSKRLLVQLGDGELVKFLLDCCRRRRKQTDIAVVFALLGIAWEMVTNSRDIRKDLDKVAENALPRILRFGTSRPAILLDVTRPRLKKNFRDAPSFLDQTWRARALIAANSN